VTTPLIFFGFFFLYLEVLLAVLKIFGKPRGPYANKATSQLKMWERMRKALLSGLFPG
jgi:hypothetical protein